ncbi:MAG: hypothetical protein M1151_01275 [Candidatus Thermoplasmatota archaeon]|jgi:hypothetical protein|nr:hypothetical protein [Candidatus Thermoplasmatota archaeon]
MNSDFMEEVDYSLAMDIIRYLQWPGEDSKDEWLGEDLRRPTAYWIYEKIRGEAKQLRMRGSSKALPSKYSVFLHYNIILRSFIPRLVFDPSIFSHTMTSVLFADDVFVGNSPMASIFEIPRIELVQKGLGFGPAGIFPVLSVNVLHRNEDELRETVEKIQAISPSIQEFYRVRNYLLLPKSGNKGNPMAFFREMRELTRKVLVGIMKYPLIPLNKLATRIDEKRDKVYREFSRIAGSGLFKIEYSVANPKIEGISLFQSGFPVNEGEKEKFLANLKSFPELNERLLIARMSFRDILYTVNWCNNYMDFVRLHLKFKEYLGIERPFLSVWEPITYYNKMTSLRMVNGN